MGMYSVLLRVGGDGDGVDGDVLRWASCGGDGGVLHFTACGW